MVRKARRARKARRDPRIKRLERVVAILAAFIVVLIAYIAYQYLAVLFKPVPVGARTTGIDTALSASQLAAINNAPNSYFEVAGEKMLNLTIKGEKFYNDTYSAPLFEVSLMHPVQYNNFVINGRPVVIYIGAISCIYCGENRWAMALALSRFGSFDTLYTGYSSLGDGDIPTLYWSQQNYTTSGLVSFGNYYNSSYINFISAEYDSPISSGFQFPVAQNPITYFVANATNQSDLAAMQFMNSTNLFRGTPFTFWGSSINQGADAVVFGNATAFSTTTNYLPLSYMTHSQIYKLLSQSNSTFAYEEYAAADVYIAETCPAINNSASVCSLPAIKEIEAKMGI